MAGLAAIRILTLKIGFSVRIHPPRPVRTKATYFVVTALFTQCLVGMSTSIFRYLKLIGNPDEPDQEKEECGNLVETVLTTILSSEKCYC